MAKKIFKRILFVVVVVIALALVVFLVPFATLILIFYIIFALPRELKLDHERKMYKLTHKDEFTKASPIDKLLGKINKFAKF